MKKVIMGLSILAVVIFATGQVVSATSNAELLTRIQQLEGNAASAASTDTSGVIGQISDKITLSGAIELDYSYIDDSDVSSTMNNDSTSELEVGTVELGLNIDLHEYVTANILLKGESLDSDSDRIFWDEVFFTFQKQDMPFYFIGGKRTQPFGVYESLFINDPVTQDLYEINDSGATIGYADENLLGLDVSVTVYKGEALIDRVNSAGYGWSRNNSAGYAVTNDVSSLIVSTSLSPVEGLVLSAFYNSEPGDTDRNTTLGGAVHYEYAGFMADAEYIGALEREKHVADDQEYKESAWVVSLGYQVTDPLVLAVRYEAFDADKEQAQNLERRYGVGASYTMIEDDSFVCTLLTEYRRTEYETSPGSVNDSDADEFFARVAIEF